MQCWKIGKNDGIKRRIHTNSNMSSSMMMSSKKEDPLPNVAPIVRKKSSSATPSSLTPLGPVLLPWDRFSYWVHSILVVTFDIEMGQSLEAIYPANNHAKLSANDKTNICYMSFPDSNSGVLGDTQYHFRFH